MEELTLSAQHLYNLIKLDYEATDVQQQKYFIEHIVDIIATKVGELYPVYRTHPKIPHGSFYQRTKIEQAREFDFLHPFVFSENKGIRIQNKSTFPTSSPDATEVYITSYLKNILSQPKENHNLLQYADYTINKRLNPIPDILETLHKAVSDALIELDSDSECHIVYRGECDLKRSKIEFLEVGETDPHILSLNEVALDANDFGPCITLAIGGPLCISHVDMTFCIEDLKMNSEREWRERYFVLLRYGFLQNNWLRTYYKPGYKELDEHHTKILVLMKKCFVECKKYQYDSTYTSHVLRTLVLSHHQVCEDETSLGRCFYKVAIHVLRMAIQDPEDNEKLYISSEWLGSLKNVTYPVGVSIINEGSNLFPTDLLFTLSLYILVQFMRYPHTVDSLCTTKLISVFIQVICKYSSAALKIQVGGILQTEVESYESEILIERVHNFLFELRYMRYKGGAINSILSHPPLPYIPYCPDPEQPIRISLTGKIEKICKEEERGEWEMWRHTIEQNIGLTRFMELRKHQKNIRKWEQIRRQEISHLAKENNASRGNKTPGESYTRGDQTSRISHTPGGY
ncbi:unnamed protein product [Owenia fusiformis]|uniref:Uncharacterized protein n=1 Tax=Owenia fusiformis TaxID=6347 RepID=A0A8S4PHY6_OWEFU|nr:unnamed protein product [Owenia fusiformis]